MFRNFAFFLLLGMGIVFLPVAGYGQAIFSGGERSTCASATLGPAGGFLQMALDKHATQSIVVEFPVGAVSETVTAEIGWEKGILRGVKGKWSEKAFFLKTDKIVEFNQPVRIKIPITYERAKTVMVGYLIDEKGRLQSLQLVKIDEAGKVVLFDTFQPGLFTWILAAL